MTRQSDQPSVDGGMTGDEWFPTTAEQCVMVCPQCDGEGGYPDGIDEDACHTDCTRCAGNGWVVDLRALEEFGPAIDTGEA